MNHKQAVISLSVTTIVVLIAVSIAIALTPAGHVPSRYPTKIPGIYWSPRG